MKGYKKIHAIAHCRDCNFKDEDFQTAQETARKHNKEKGHTVDVEIGYWRMYK